MPPTRRAAAAPKLLRFAVVGAGSISREFALQHLLPASGATVVSIVDVDAERAKTLAADVGAIQAGAKLLGRGYRASAAEACGEPVLHATALDASVLAAADAVYIGTTPGSHAALVETALQADKHVLLEKPLAATRDDADAIVRAAEAAGARGLHVGMNIGMRWNASLRRMRALAIEQHALGTLASGRLDMHYATWPREWQVQPWVGRRAEGGPLREVGTHFFAALLELFGPTSVRRVRCELAYPDGPDGELAEEAVDGTLELEGGVRVALSVRTDGSGLASDGDDHYELELVGEAGDALMLDAFTNLVETRKRKRKTLLRADGYGRKECVAALVAAATGDADADAAQRAVTPRFARNVQRVLDSLLASNGQWVAVEYD